MVNSLLEPPQNLYSDHVDDINNRTLEHSKMDYYITDKKPSIDLPTIEAFERLHNRNRVLNEQNLKQKQVIFKAKAKIQELRKAIGEERLDQLKWI